MNDALSLHVHDVLIQEFILFWAQTICKKTALAQRLVSVSQRRSRKKMSGKR